MFGLFKKKEEETTQPPIENTTITIDAIQKFIEQLDHLVNTKRRERQNPKLRRFSHSCLMFGDGSGTILRHSTQALEDVVVAKFRNNEELQELLTKAYQIIKVK